MADTLGQPPAESPRTPGGTTAAAPTEPHQQLLHVLSRVLVQLDTDASFGQRQLDEDARVSTIAQVRSFVHGRDDEPVDAAVLCRLAQILRDDGQSESAAILYLQQIAELSHNPDIGHVTGVYGAVSEHDMLDMISLRSDWHSLRSKMGAKVSALRTQAPRRDSLAPQHATAS